MTETADELGAPLLELNMFSEPTPDDLEDKRYYALCELKRELDEAAAEQPVEAAPLIWSLEDAAAILNKGSPGLRITPRTLRNEGARGRLTISKIGGKPCVTPSNLSKYLETCLAPPNPPALSSMAPRLSRVASTGSNQDSRPIPSISSPTRMDAVLSAQRAVASLKNLKRSGS